MVASVQAREIASLKVEKDKEIAALKARVQKAEQENVAIKNYICAKDPKATICK